MTVNSDDMQMLVDTAREWIRDHAPAQPGLQRDRGLGTGQWRGMAEMGWAGVAVPEAKGGAGFGVAGLGTLLTEAGREIADVPLLANGIVAALTARFGSELAQTQLLPGLLSGEARAGLALCEGAHHGREPTATRAERSGDGWRIEGRKSWVQGAAEADLLLVAAAGDGPELFLVDTQDVRIETLSSADGRSFAHVHLDDVLVPGTRGLRGADALAGYALSLARAGTAAEMVGAADRALEIILEFLRTREQFGRKIGSFQALQHRAAIMLVEIELARSCVAAALAAIDEDRDEIEELAVVAKYMAGEAIHLVSNEMVQMHGGIGMTAEHVAGNYLKWARVSEALFGGNAILADRYAEIRGY